MDFSIAPLVLILISLAAIAIILVRKFPQLTVLDADNIPQVKEAKKKDEILRNRAERKAVVAKVVLGKRLQPLLQRLKEAQLSFRCYVGKIEKMILQESKKEERSLPADVKQKRVDEIRALLNEGSFAMSQDDLNTAEKKFIAVIKLDTKNKEAYQNLGEVYIKQKQPVEAIETLKFLLQLDPKNELTYVRLADLAENEGKIGEAVSFYNQAVLLNDSIPSRFAKLAELLGSLRQYPTALEAIKQAVELEPQNPKYLDNLAEISIMAGDKSQAESAYGQLRTANPENQKLPALRDKIDKMN